MKKILFCLAVLFLSIWFTNADNIKELEEIEKLLTNTATHQEDDSTTKQVKTKKQLTIPEFNLITHLWFNKDECKMTQDEHSHHLLKWWSMYGVDIACWSDVTIVAPNYLYWDYQYTVAKVWRDKYIWDYITLDFPLWDWDIWTIVYGHTSTQLKVGDKLKAWELLWKYSPTGKTTWPHTHIELWKWWKNYTFDWHTQNPKSMRLRVQRWRASYADMPTVVAVVKETAWDLYSILRNFLAKYEWLRLKAYHDGWTRCSIWYGTKATSCSETITYEEANRRLDEALAWRVEQIKRDYPTANVNQQAALVSLYYNCPSWYRWLAWYPTKAKRTKCSTAWGKYLRWLYNRRLAEWDLYSTPVN